MIRGTSSASAELAGTLWSFLEREVRGFRIPALEDFTPAELDGFVSGLRCARDLIKHTCRRDPATIDHMESCLMLVEIVARDQLRRAGSTPALVLAPVKVAHEPANGTAGG